MPSGVCSPAGRRAAAAGLVALVGGPWLRVTDAGTGEQFTPQRDLERVLDGSVASLLAVDRALRERLERLPAVAEATVTARCRGASRSASSSGGRRSCGTPRPRGCSARADGTLFAALAPDPTLDAGLPPCPRVSDERAMARLMRAGDSDPGTSCARPARQPRSRGARLQRRAARACGSTTSSGSGLVAAEPGWEMAFGVYGTDPTRPPETLPRASSDR